MGFLAPFYIAGILAVGIPILLHLIRRTPQGRQLFSSLMFLTPSPPRLTKRSRLSNILLLLIRAAAITLLALAFTRPFFHWNSAGDTQPSSGRRILFLLDTSASMRRPNLWADAKAQIESQLKDITPADEVGLYLFDRDLRPAMTMSQWSESPPPQRLSIFRAALASAAPTWSATRLGDALSAAADLASENNSAAGNLKLSRTIILISDLQEGDKAQALLGREWPKDVAVKKGLLPLTSKHPGNASIQWVESGPVVPTPPSTVPAQATTSTPAAPARRTAPTQPGSLAQSDGTLRIRIANQPDSTSEQFTLTWHNDKGLISADPPTPIYCAPGHSQIVKVQLPSDGTLPDRLVLSGDDCDFDNTLYLVPPQTESLRILYAGNDAATDVNALLYYLKSALFDTPLRTLDLIARPATNPVQAADLTNTRLAVITRPPTDAEIALLKKFVQDGGDVLWVGKDVDTLKRSSALLDLPLEVSEAAVGGEGYSLLNRVDLAAPIFSPFADARFSDFTKIHFWKHRQVKWNSASPLAPQILATFDDGDPFLMVAATHLSERKTPEEAAKTAGGEVVVLASGWQPTDSQLALSSKFVPLLEQLVRRKDALTVGAQYTVDDAIPIPAPDPNTTAQITTPDGKTLDLPDAKVFTATTRPGVYHLKSGSKQAQFAVNLSPDESHTQPGVLEDLAQYGVQFTSDQSVKTAADQQRILLNNELENKQKTWRWLLLSVLGLLAIETALAGRLSRRAITERAAA